MTDTKAAELLAAVEQSPAAAAAHDRAGWAGLFSADGRVEDPVGSRPHVGPDQIGRFYDTFIGPRDITFHRDLDIVHGDDGRSGSAARGRDGTVRHHAHSGDPAL